MRFFCGSFALGLGLLGLIPESADACDRRFYRGGFGYPVASHAYAPPVATYAYYPPAPYGYYPAQAYYPPPMYAGQPPAAYQSFYPPAARPTTPTTIVDVTLYENRFEPATRSRFGWIALRDCSTLVDTALVPPTTMILSGSRSWSAAAVGAESELGSVSSTGPPWAPPAAAAASASG